MTESSNTNGSGSTSTLFKVLGSVVTVGCVSLAVWYYGQNNSTVVQKQREEDRLGTTQAKKKKVRFLTKEEEDADLMLKDLFDEARMIASQLVDISDSDKLAMYGLFKQATVGNNKNQTPSVFNFVERAKHTSWLKHHGLSELEAMMGYVEVVRRLVQGEQVGDMRGGMGLKPSTMAHAEGDEEDEDDDDLRKAVGSKDWALVKDLIRRGADPDGADETGQTALFLCADRGWKEGVTVLVDAGANVNATDRDGIGVLQTAVIADRIEIASLLMQHGADPDLADTDGDSPRSCAMEHGSDAIKALFTNGIKK